MAVRSRREWAPQPPPDLRSVLSIFDRVFPETHNGPPSVSEKALDALSPELAWEVRMHLETKPEGTQRAIRAVGLRSGRFFLLDCDDGVWHLPDEDNAIGALLAASPRPRVWE